MVGGVKVVRDPARPEEEKNKFESAAFPECRMIRAIRVRRHTTNTNVNKTYTKTCSKKVGGHFHPPPPLFFQYEFRVWVS